MTEFFCEKVLKECIGGCDIMDPFLVTRGFVEKFIVCEEVSLAFPVSKFVRMEEGRDGQGKSVCVLYHSATGTSGTIMSIVISKTAARDIFTQLKGFSKA